MARLLRPVMKIMSVMPAAAASSTAYWISGLSTTGSISLGLALVTGRNRLPSPATGNTALVTLSNAMGEFPELLLVDHRHFQLLGPGELAAGIVASDDVAGFLGYAAGDLAAATLDQVLRLVARERRQRSRKHESESHERASLRAPRRLLRPMYACGAKLSNHLAVVPLRKKLANGLRQHRTDIRDFQQRLLVGVQERVELAEVLRQIPRGRLADMANSQRENEAREG